ncbi:lysophospholipid acyltransferase family protein [Roseibium limicola]|uniref:Lysophospholipid acyltransferase family protein n=1 Tax=Roseibium limicola TaxID=2816037 RepID=A0A939J776_9HYPH|nr:lysophospholipid acyltransferase family protein [Roseibium limicola]MBO0345877.1 lysophospholipid acyltransferase family protein [Roseibium limicola]
MLKKIGRHPLVLKSIGTALAAYLKLVYRTNRFIIEPSDIYETLEPELPVIVAMWHGQHFLVPFMRPASWPFKVMISRSADGEMNAVAAEKLGIGLIRASGGHKAHQIKKRGGLRGFIAAMRALQSGCSIAMTADVPKGPARISGLGIVQLARHSGCPILPVSVATSRSLSINSWDKANFNLPFGKGAMTYGSLIRVASDADDAALEQARLQVEAGLNGTTRRAYQLLGQDHG